MSEIQDYKWFRFDDGEEHCVSNRIFNELYELRTENERLEEKHRQILSWIEAYPIKIFPEPDMKKAHEVLKAHGMTLDAISASNMRHVLNGIKEILEGQIK